MSLKYWLHEASWVERTTVGCYAVSSACFIYLSVLILTTPLYLRHVEESMGMEASGQIDNLPSLSELSVYQEIVARNPVFGVVRQKQMAPTVSACDQFKLKYILAGIIGGTTSAENEALFNSKVGSQSHMAKAGDLVEGVAVVSIQTDKVVIGCDGKQTEITMGE